MGLLTNVLLFPITGPVHGFIFILEQIRDQVNAELLDEQGVRDALDAWRTRFELGEISPEEYAAAEDALLERLNAIHIALRR